MTEKEILEAAAKRAENVLEEWSHDLYETCNDYITARTTGIMAGRRIKPDMAKLFAYEFKERSEAVYGCIDMVKKAILNEEGK